MLLLGTVAFAGIGLLMAGTLRAEANLAAANGLFLVLLVPRRHGVPARQAADRAAGLRQAAARGRALGDRPRRALAAQPFPAGELVVLVVWAVAAPLLAARYFRWEE